MKLLSIVIPTRNRSQFLQKSLSQLPHNFLNSNEVELIVVDDGSDQNNKSSNYEICSSINYCQYIYKQFGSAPKARNYGFSISTGKNIWFLDDDDYITEKTFYQVINHLKNDIEENLFLILPCKKVYSNDENDVIYTYPTKERNSFEEYRAKGHQVNTSCTLFSRKVISEIGGWDENLKTGQDTDLFLRASEISKIKCLNVEPIIVNVAHQDRIGKKVFKQQIGKTQFLKKHWRVLTFKRKYYYILTTLLWIPFFKKIRSYLIFK
jgi:glycosyltransferase involved in cell wall biosynthesis